MSLLIIIIIVGRHVRVVPVSLSASVNVDEYSGGCGEVAVDRQPRQTREDFAWTTSTDVAAQQTV